MQLFRAECVKGQGTWNSRCPLAWVDFAYGRKEKLGKTLAASHSGKSVKEEILSKMNEQ